MFCQERKFSPKRKFSAGHPCGHPAKNFGQALQILENKHFGTDIPRGRPRKNFGLKNFGLIFRSLFWTPDARGFCLLHGSGTKNEPKPKLLSPDIFRWGRGLPHEGVGAKKFGMPLETREIKLFWQDIPGFCRDIPEAPEKFEKKMFGFNFWPLMVSVISADPALNPLHCGCLSRPRRFRDFPSLW